MVLLVVPYVLSIGTIYDALSQLYVLVAVLIDDNDLVCNAAQINASVASGNILLQFLVWRSTTDILSATAAAFRAAAFLVVGVVMMVISYRLYYMTKGKKSSKHVSDDKKGN